MNADLVINKIAYVLPSNVSFNNSTVKYDAQEHEITVEGLPTGITATYTNNKGTNVGTYNAEATFVLSEDLQVNYKEVSPAKMNATLEITAKEVSKDQLDIKMPSAEGLIYDGTQKVAEVEAAENVIGLGNITIKYYPVINGVEGEGTTTAPINAGEYKVKVDISAGTNYTGIENLEVGTFTIAKRAITIKADNKTSMYGEPKQELTYTIAPENALVNGDKETVVLTTEASETANVGTYDITGTATISDNYEITFEKVTYEITKRIITVTADNKTSIYGEPKQELTYQITEGNIVNNDMIFVSLDTQASETANVGTYDITGTATISDNYAITFIKGTYEITKRAITITANNAESVYGEPRAELGYTIVSDNKLVNGDTIANVEYSVDVDETTEVGEYDIEITSVSISSNYTTTFEKGKYNVTPKAIDNSKVTYSSALRRVG